MHKPYWNSLDFVCIPTEDGWEREKLATLAQVKTPRWKQKDKLEKFIDNLTQKTLTHIQAFSYGLKAEF